MKIIQIYFSEDRKHLFLYGIEDNGIYTIYHSESPFIEKNRVYKGNLSVTPVCLKMGVFFYRDKYRKNSFNIPNCDSSELLNLETIINYRKKLFDDYCGMKFYTLEKEGGNVSYINKKRLNIPQYFIVKNGYFIDCETLILLCTSTLSHSMLLRYDIKEGILNYYKTENNHSFPIRYFKHQKIGDNKVPCLTHISKKDKVIVICFHGGPAYNYSHEYSDIIFELTKRFDNLCLVNYPGSTGYSKKYESSLIGNGGIVDIEAAKSVIEYYALQGFSIKIYGESYGAYIAICLSKYNHFDITRIVAVSGFTNLTYMYFFSDSRKLINKYFSDFKRFSPEKNLKKSSLLPIKFLHGRNDKTCPIFQIEYFVANFCNMDLTTLEGFSHYETSPKKIKIKNNVILKLLK